MSPTGPGRETAMPSRQAIWQKKKRSTDPEYREKLRLESEAYWAANKDEIKAARRERRKTDPEYREKQSYYKTRCLYGISDDDRDALLASQGGVCAICRQKSERPLGIDHCHSSGKVRGFLCFKCNAGLGMFNDDTDRMRAAIAYLERPRRELALKTEPGENARATNIS